VRDQFRVDWFVSEFVSELLRFSLYDLLLLEAGS
jgi:hypothetical protein